MDQNTCEIQMLIVALIRYVNTNTYYPINRYIALQEHNHKAVDCFTIALHSFHCEALGAVAAHVGTRRTSCL
jgi:hypothetical protein